MLWCDRLDCGTLRAAREAALSERYERMKDAVRALFDRNRQQGIASWCGLGYDFVCPSPGTYPFQWFWDSCFHAVVLSHFDVERARSEVRSLLANAQDDGFVAHVTFWQREHYEDLLSTYSIAYRTPYLSDCMQPPCLAEAVAAAAEGPGGEQFLAEVMPRVLAYYEWLARVRDPDRDGLIATLQPDESGLDHAPKYDEYLGVTGTSQGDLDDAWQRVAGPYAEVGRDPQRMFALDRFICEDVFVNTIYAENLRVLGGLLEKSGKPNEAARRYRRADHTVSSLAAKCWDAETGLFYDLAGRGERRLRMNTISSLVPILLDIPRRAVDGIVRQLGDERTYAAPFPVPSVALNEPSYLPGANDRKLVWRGPTWINSNWYIARGLRRHGYHDLARGIEDRSAALVENNGFREYYDPWTGAGYGAENFAWSGLALDMLARHEGLR